MVDTRKERKKVSGGNKIIIFKSNGWDICLIMCGTMLYCKRQGLLLSLNSQTFVISNFKYKVGKCFNNNDDDEEEATEKIP